MDSKGLSGSHLLEAGERKQKGPSSLDCMMRPLVAGNKYGILCRGRGQKKGCEMLGVVGGNPIRLTTTSIPEPRIEDPGQTEYQAWKGRGAGGEYVWGVAGGGSLGTELEDPLCAFSR